MLPSPPSPQSTASSTSGCDAGTPPAAAPARSPPCHPARPAARDRRGAVVAGHLAHDRCRRSAPCCAARSRTMTRRRRSAPRRASCARTAWCAKSVFEFFHPTTNRRLCHAQASRRRIQAAALGHGEERANVVPVEATPQFVVGRPSRSGASAAIRSAKQPSPRLQSIGDAESMSGPATVGARRSRAAHGRIVPVRRQRLSIAGLWISPKRRTFAARYRPLQRSPLCR